METLCNLSVNNLGDAFFFNRKEETTQTVPGLNPSPNIPNSLVTFS